MTDMTDSKPICWYRLTPDHVVVGLLVVECLLWLSEHYRWFGFNEKKGWTVLIGLAVVGLAFLVMLLWFIASLLFRWRFQFSIRSLLIMAVVVAIPCSWLVVELKAAGQQHEAMKTITVIGGIVHPDWEIDENDDSVPIAHPPGTEWLRNLLGVDFFGTAVQAHLTRRPATDVTLEHLDGLPQLHLLALDGTQVTDTGLQRVKGLTKLRMLWLDDTSVTDTGLKYLRGVTTLQLLSLVNTDVTDAGLGHLEKLTQLEILYLGGTKVTREGVIKVRQALPHCSIARQIRPRVYKVLPAMYTDCYGSVQ